MSSTQPLRLRTLARAAELLGGEKPLAIYLELPPVAVEFMIAGKTPIPERVFLQVVDLIVEQDVGQLTGRSAVSSE